MDPKNLLQFSYVGSHSCSLRPPATQPFSEPKASLMPKVALTEISIKALKPVGAQVTYWDASLPNFGVRVGKLRKTFVVLVGSTTRRRVKLGTYPELSIAKAREAARRKLYSPEPEFVPPASTTTFSEALDIFIATYSKQRHRPSTAQENKRILERHFNSCFANRELASIKPAEIAEIIDALQETPSAMDHAYRVLRTFLNFCCKRSYLDISPLAKMEPPPKGASRERTLIPAKFLGALIVAHITNQSFGRADQLERGEKVKPLYLFADEFHNFVSGDFETILSETRKYGLFFRLANQYPDQLDHRLHEGILTNCDTKITFRCSPNTASAMAPVFGLHQPILVNDHAGTPFCDEGVHMPPAAEPWAAASRFRCVI
jgi:Phage integrase, N-terminal SAM-like domain/Arm DNA-binding domain/TraM recognition site of TraD and TraG